MSASAKPMFGFFAQLQRHALQVSIGSGAHDQVATSSIL